LHERIQSLDLLKLPRWTQCLEVACVVVLDF
jgi:hypothetical protein